MIDKHVHCANCGCAIATELKVAGGKTKPIEYKQMVRNYVAPGPQPGTLAFLQQIVPMCDDCCAQIEAANAAEEAKAKSRLIIPTVGPGGPIGPPNGPV